MRVGYGQVKRREGWSGSGVKRREGCLGLALVLLPSLQNIPKEEN